MADLQEQAAGQTDVEWIAAAARTQAKLTRELAGRQAALARGILE
jgi:hypothetical protein